MSDHREKMREALRDYCARPENQMEWIRNTEDAILDALEGWSPPMTAISPVAKRLDALEGRDQAYQDNEKQFVRWMREYDERVKALEDA